MVEKLERAALMLVFACFLMLFGLACNSVPENWHICVKKGHTYLQLNWFTTVSAQGLA